MTAILENCLALRAAYEAGLLGNQAMPEDTHPVFKNNEDRLAFFTLPMSLNYQRNSYALWSAATATYADAQCSNIFSLTAIATMSEDELRQKLLTHKVALQPNKHTHTWHVIASAIHKN